MKPTVLTGRTFVWVLQLVLVGFLQAPIPCASQEAHGKAEAASATVHAGGQVDVFSGTDRNAVQISSSRFR